MVIFSHTILCIKSSKIQYHFKIFINDQFPFRILFLYSYFFSLGKNLKKSLNTNIRNQIDPKACGIIKHKDFILEAYVVEFQRLL